MPADNLAVQRFEFWYNKGTEWEEKSVVRVWCEGKEYDPKTESYHPRFSYKITTPKWEYVDNDIRGAANEVCDPNSGAQSLFAFLYACQEGMPFKPGQLIRNENADLFPEHVREWAYLHSEQLTLANLSLEALNLK